MSSLVVSPYYCPEDKDILDFVNSTGIAMEDLVIFLRNRGVYTSSSVTRNDLAELISSEAFSWVDLSELIGLLATTRAREKFTFGTHKSEAEFDNIEKAVSQVHTARLEKYGDRVQITSPEEGVYKVAIDYVVTDYEKTRLIQRVEREATIEFRKTDTGFKSMRSSDDRARDVELAILGQFEQLAKAEDKTLESTHILLSQLIDVSEKIAFFAQLMEGINGYNFQQMKSVRVQSVKVDAEILDSEDGDELAKEYVSRIESLVINGRNVGASTLYDEYVGKDFFILSAVWVAASDTDQCRQVELKAAFVPHLDNHELQLSTTGVRMYSADELQPKTKPSPMVSTRFAELLRESAENALASVMQGRKEDEDE